jgi:hypothetical protein
MAKSANSSTGAIQGFAEDLGTVLGTTRRKAEGWLGQRQAIVKNLTELRDTATKLLTDLGHQAERVVRRGRKSGRPAGSKNKRGPGRAKATEVLFPRKRRKMSAAARKRISDAQKARWAKLKADEKKK